MTDLLTVVTVRCGSERYPGKVIAPVAGQPLLRWLLQRVTDPVAGLPGKVVVATTDRPEDDAIEAAAAGFEVYRHPGDPNDVVSRIDALVQKYRPAGVFRCLGDCPLLATEIVRRSWHVLNKTGAESFLWYLPPHVWPIYGAREFPYSNKAWRKTTANARGDEREHSDLYFNRHRDRFNIVYHAAPDAVYFRHQSKVRVEFDWPEDVAVMEAIANGPGLLAPFPDIIRWLDKHEEVTRLNRCRQEKTGPVVSYDNELHWHWFKLMQNAPVYTWDNKTLEPEPKSRQHQIHCDCGALLGWGWNGVLYTPDGHRVEQGWVACQGCGGGKHWRRAI